MPDLEILLQSLRDLDVTPFVFAIVLGGLIGFEREIHGRPAGLRTHILVCLSATLLIAVSRQLAGSENLPLGETGRLVFDPNRMGAGIVTGIGFLGAATVIRSGDLLRGLTTAACIWYVAGLGIVLGTGHYALGTTATLAVLFVLVFINRFTFFIKPVIYRRLLVEAESCDINRLVAEIRAEFDKNKMRLLDIASNSNGVEKRTELTFYLALKNKFQAPDLVQTVTRFYGVTKARWRLIN